MGADDLVCANTRGCVQSPTMMPLFLRRADAPDLVVGPMSPDQILEAAPSGDDCLALRASDPFVPADHDLDRNAPLREALLDAFPLDRASRFATVRYLLLAGLVPMLLLVVVDGAMLQAGRPGAASALSVDVLCAVFVAVDLARRCPRHPHVVAAAFGATGLRLAQLVAARCGDVHFLYGLFSLVACICAVAMLALAPTPRSVADHLRIALAMAPPTRLPPRTTPGFFAYIIYAVLAAACLPLLLWILQTTRMSLGVQLAVFILFAAIVPYVGRVFVGRELPAHRDSIASALGIPSSMFRLSAPIALRALLRVSTIAIAGLILSFALVRGSQQAVDAVASTQHCLIGMDKPPPALQRFVDAQRVALDDITNPPDPSWLLLTVLVVPVAEELVYRGLVQHALRRRLERRVAIGLAAVLFGLAHVAAYQGTAYQAVLLGLSFGLAYERAGILAGILVHMLWNLWLSI